ncbi:NAD(+) diphosphatase [Kineococcus radiotolerans]|uniref:NAD(+) diphosphatase n=1 Tax=Kineococcus radiotolerans TaxID=131568 RepID=UPI00003A4879|nr:NAD(+) diphosphatase [Kineococcus radiotolerans]
MTPVPLPSPPLRDLALSRQHLDRAGVNRVSPSRLAELWASPGTRVLQVHAGRAPVVSTPAGPRLVLRAPAEVPAPGPDDLQLYLGVDDGVHHVAVVSPDAEPETTDGAGGGEEWRGLREVGEQLPARDAGLFTEALSMGNWHAVTRFSPRTGQPLVPASSGWVKVEPDGKEHFPRTDAAVIMAVISPDDELLLGHQPVWPENRYSVLAGFVEPGECFEDTVRREAFEEAGIVVGSEPDDVRYLGSQPWPFPASLMVGFAARAVTTDIKVDGDEIALARWFSRAQLAEELAAGRVLPPPGVSIARRLIEAWYGGPIPVPDERPWA